MEENEESSKLLYGVVEGFYGHPWTLIQREHLIYSLSRLNLNSYIYAPKDDLKHRNDWRTLYTPEESENLRRIIELCRACSVKFIYSISPGNEITYSSQIDRATLKLKIEQVLALGAHGIGVFFDDIEIALEDADACLYETLADAQVDLTNTLYQALDSPKIFIFCPTEYCSSRAMPSLIKSKYLNIIGRNLISEIMVMWTGPRVISKQIPADHIETLRRILKRPPLIWDNLHANDYDRHNIFLGPYHGRPQDLYSLTSGIFLNPNCQYELNFMALNSFGMWVSASALLTNQSIYNEPTFNSPIKNSRSHNFSFNPAEYDSERSFRECCRLWAEEFKKPSSYHQFHIQRRVTGLQSISFNNNFASTASSNLSNVSFDSEASQLSETSAETIDIDCSPTLTYSNKFPTQTDILRVASFFYIPGQLGSYAQDFYTNFCHVIHNSNNMWQKKLRDNFAATNVIDSKRNNFKRHCEKIFNSIKKISKSPNHTLRILLSPYLLEIKDTLQSMRMYVRYLEHRETHFDDSVISEPADVINHSRFAVEIQKLMPSFMFSDITNDVKIDAPVVVIRPPHDYDLERLETICYGHLINKFGFWDDLRPSKDLSNLRYLATFLRAQYEMFVVEDVDNLCGYMIYKTESDLKLEEQLENEYNEMLIENRNVGENIWDSYVKYPMGCQSILTEYPMRISFIFQVGFRKSHIIPKLIEYAMRKMVQRNIRGCHVVVDRFELIEPSLLKKNGFYLHSNGNFQNYKYYVLDREQVA